MKRTVFFLLLLLTSACAAQPTQESSPTATGMPFVITPEENPYAPRLEDVSMRQDDVTLTSTTLSERFDLTPIRAELHVLGNMPSVCSELRIKVYQPNVQYQINIEVYSIANPKLNCENVFQQFETTLLLGEYSAGQYTVWVNDQFVGSVASY
jgi:hypothetical protein